MPALIERRRPVRHPRRDHALPRRRLRPPHRGPHHLTRVFPVPPSVVASGGYPHEHPRTWLEQLAGGGGGRAPPRSSASRSTSRMSMLTDGLDLPRRADACRCRRVGVARRAPSNVRCSGWMSSSTPQRTSGTARSRWKARPFEARMIRGLGLDRDVPPTERVGQDAPPGATQRGAEPCRVSSSVRRKRPEPGRAGAPAPIDGDERPRRST